MLFTTRNLEAQNPVEAKALFRRLSHSLAALAMLFVMSTSDALAIRQLTAEQIAAAQAYIAEQDLGDAPDIELDVSGREPPTRSPTAHALFLAVMALSYLAH